MVYDPDRIPMRELERITGLTRMTINFYIKEGLLPRPEKTARNMAYYNQEFVERVKYILKLRNQHNLSLAQIKQILQSNLEDQSMSLLISVHDRIYGRATTNRLNDRLTWEELRQRTELSDDQLHRLEQLKLLYPDTHKSKRDGSGMRYHPDSLVMGQLVKKMLDLGITLDEIAPIAVQVDQISRDEADIYNRHNLNELPAINGDEKDRATILQLGLSFLALAHLHSLYEYFHTSPAEGEE